MSRSRTSGRRVLAWVAWFVTLAALGGSAARTQGPSATSARSADERFIESLARGGPDEPLDRKQLALMFGRVATALANGKSALETTMFERESPPVTSGAVPDLLRERFEAYQRNLANFSRHVDELKEEPNSRLAFYQVFASGQKTCWTLDLFSRSVEMRGADPQRQLVQLPSREACALFRSAVFQPRVEAILQDALVEQVYQRQELNRLRQEVRELEQLVEDLIHDKSAQ